MEGIVFIPTTNLSDKAKARLEVMKLKNEKRLQSMVEDCKNGRFDEIIKYLPKNI